MIRGHVKPSVTINIVRSSFEQIGEKQYRCKVKIALYQKCMVLMLLGCITVHVLQESQRMSRWPTHSCSVFSTGSIGLFCSGKQARLISTASMIKVVGLRVPSCQILLQA